MGGLPYRQRHNTRRPRVPAPISPRPLIIYGTQSQSQKLGRKHESPFETQQERREFQFHFTTGMAATACAYGGYESSCRSPPPAAMGSPTAARSLRVMDLFNDDGHGSSIIHGSVFMPPPPPPPPPLVDLHSSSRSSSKATSRRPGLCTEGLGSESSESSGDLDLANVPDDTDKEDAGQALQYCKRQYFDNHEEEMMPMLMPARTRGRRVFPPPISVIGAAGKPWQYLRAHRGDGRLVLREVRIPSRELLQACREDGRLKLHFAHPEERQQLVDEQCHEQDTKN